MAVWVGVLCAIIGNTLNGVSFQMQRYVHANNAHREPYVKFPLWWIGLICMLTGEIGNMIAYGLAPASLVSPLGVVGIVANAILSRVFLKEVIPTRGVIGIVCSVAGSVLVVLGAPESDVSTSIYENVVSWEGLGLLCVVLLGCAYIMNPLRLTIAISDDFANTYVVCYCTVCSLCGAVTVTSSKVVSTALTQAVNGDYTEFISGETRWLTYTLAIGMIIFNMYQIRVLNIALIHFESTQVMPVYYIIFTSVSIATGMVVFHETSFDPVVQKALLFACGVALAFVGVYLINSEKTPATLVKRNTLLSNPEIRDDLVRQNQK